MTAAAPNATTDGYRMVVPAPPLRPFVESLWVHAVPAWLPDLRLLPDGRMQIVWRAGHGAWLVGPKSQWLDHPVSGAFATFGATFRPGAAPALLRVPARELVDGRVALADVDGRLAARLEQRLATAGSHDEALAAFDGELTRHLREPPALDPVVLAAVDLLSDSSIPVADVADRVYLSERQLQRRFHERVGYGPKTFQRILRFQDVLARLRSGAGPAQAAAGAGYADQSHLFRESRRLAGLSPRSLVGPKPGRGQASCTPSAGALLHKGSIRTPMQHGRTQRRSLGVRALAVLGVAVLGAGGAFAAAAVDSAVDRCDGPLDLSHWRSPPGDEQQDTARSIARCGYLDGADRGRVAALLGPPTERERSVWYYEVGNVGYALTDGQALVLEFGPHGTVTGARMLR